MICTTLPGVSDDNLAVLVHVTDSSCSFICGCHAKNLQIPTVIFLKRDTSTPSCAQVHADFDRLLEFAAAAAFHAAGKFSLRQAVFSIPQSERSLLFIP